MKLKSEIIRRARQEKGYSQEYVAFMLGVSQSQYSKLEKGNAVFGIETLFKMLDILDVRLLEIYDFSEKEKSLIISDLDLSSLSLSELKNINGGEGKFSYLAFNQIFA